VHGRGSIQEALTQPKTGLYQGIPGLQPADAVDAETAVMLKCFDGCTRRRTEDAVRVERRTRQDGRESLLNVADGGSTIADGEGKFYRYGEISSSN
jgi:hypothetical protein